MRALLHASGIAAMAVFCTTVAAADRAKKSDKESQVTCATSARDLRVNSLVDLFLKSKGRYKLERKAGCLGDESGRELPAVLLALPEYTEPYAVHVAAEIRSDFVMPVISLLDENYAVTRELSGSELKRRGAEVSADVFINPENASERFVLVHVDPEKVGSTESRVMMSTSMAAFPVSPAGVVGTWTSGHDHTQELKIVDSGRLTLTLVGEQWDAALKKNKK